MDCAASFQTLPGEILAHIVHCLEPSFFHECVGRLYLFKRWYPIALDVFQTHVQVRTKHLQKHFIPMTTVIPIRPELPDWARTRTRSLTINLFASDDLPSGPLNERKLSLHGMAQYLAYQYDSRKRFVEFLEQLRGLKILRLIYWPFHYPHHSTSEEGSNGRNSHEEASPRGSNGAWAALMVFMIAQLCPTSLPPGLTRLDLDLLGARFRLSDRNPQYSISGYHAGEQGHICQTINKLLGQLPSLRDIRMRLVVVCPALFAAAAYEPGSLALETLILNLSTCENGKPCSVYREHSVRPCYAPEGVPHGPDSHRATQTALRAFVPLLKLPQMVRLILPGCWFRGAGWYSSGVPESYCSSGPPMANRALDFLGEDGEQGLWPLPMNNHDWAWQGRSEATKPDLSQT